MPWSKRDLPCHDRYMIVYRKFVLVSAPSWFIKSSMNNKMYEVETNQNVVVRSILQASRSLARMSKDDVRGGYTSLEDLGHLPS